MTTVIKITPAGEIDTIRCGSGHDTVLADPTDHIASDCEDIRR